MIDATPLKSSQAESTNYVSVFSLEYLTLVVPFRLHFGWITAATIVNANVVLVDSTDRVSCLLSGAIISLVVLAVFATLMRTNQVSLFSSEFDIPLHKH